MNERKTTRNKKVQIIKKDIHIEMKDRKTEDIITNININIKVNDRKTKKK